MGELILSDSENVMMVRCYVWQTLSVAVRSRWEWFTGRRCYCAMHCFHHCSCGTPCL